ncbi:MAG: hypothetical protein KDD38_09135, partial [Bdellovibrionales bacterium]|nr:hypothetical protein [Bdellovibrionales bacterium]
MMKSILAYLISMSLLFSPISVALSANSAQDNLQERTAKRAFLNDLRERVIMFMDQNVAYLSGLKLCLEGQPALIDCDESLRIVRNNIEIQYPKMRRQLLLISLLSFHTHKELMQKFQAHVYNIENNLPTPFLPIDPRIKPNPIEGIWDIEYVPRTPFSDKEIESVLNAGSESVTIDGTNYKENLQNYERFYCESIFEKDHPACKSIQIQYSPKKRVLYFARRPLHEAWQGRDKRLNFEKLSLKTRRLQEAAQDNAKRKFFEIIQENPYVALMSTARPGDSEILKVVSLMLDKAQETRLEYEERMVKLSDPNVSESELLR